MGRYWLWVGARLLAGLLLVWWAFSYLTPGGSGEKEFQRALDAVKQVRTVRVASVADPYPTQHIENSWDLVCAQDAYHYKWHVVQSDPTNSGETTRDELHVGNVEYDHQADGTWSKAKYGSIGTAKAYCTHLADGTAGNLAPPLATMIQRGIIQKGDKKTVNGVRCREWLVAMKGAPGGLEHDTVCLGVDDHLPYEWTVDWVHSRTTFTDYNSPFHLELPDAAVQPASSTN
jgi:hypothetical protein